MVTHLHILFVASHNTTTVQSFHSSCTRTLTTSSFRCYERIEEFSKRNLSYSCDSLHAIEDILEAFNGNKFGAMRAKHFYSTPIFYKPRDQTGEKILVGSSLTWRIKRRSAMEALRLATMLPTQDFRCGPGRSANRRDPML
jgi:hypothetical protein